MDIEVRDWLLEVETKDKETKNMSQAEITSWLGKKAKKEENPAEEQKKKEGRGSYEEMPP